MSRARDRRDLKQYLQHLEQQYAKAPHSPVYAWRAYTAARVGGFPIPPWVAWYLDMAAAKLNELSQHGAVPVKGKIAPAIAAALGFAPGRGRVNALADAVEPDPALELACAVGLLRLGEHKLYNAYDAVAKDHGVSRSTVAAAWKKYGGGAAWGVTDK